MKNIKKLLVYPLAFVLFFGLSANECFDGVEDLANIEVPTEIDKSVEIVSDETGNFSRTEIIELLSPEIQEYSDRISDFTAESLSITVTDNIAGGSDITSGSLIFEFGTQTRSVTFNSQNEIKQVLESQTLSDIEGLEQYLKLVLTSGAGGGEEELGLNIDAQSEGSFDYTVRILISGIVEAGAAN